MARLLNARAYALLALLASAAMLAAAHAFERIGGYQPCLLCLRQREVYWIALPIAALGLGLLGRSREPFLPRVLPLLLAFIFFVGFAVAAYHAGVEWKLWKGPEACAVGSTSVSALEALAGGAESRIISCSEAPWTMAGLSMAGWNALVSLGLAALGLLSAKGERAR